MDALTRIRHSDYAHRLPYGFPSGAFLVRPPLVGNSKKGVKCHVLLNSPNFQSDKEVFQMQLSSSGLKCTFYPSKILQIPIFQVGTWRRSIWGTQYQ